MILELSLVMLKTFFRNFRGFAQFNRPAQADMIFYARYLLCSEFWSESVFDSPAGSSFGSVLVQKLPCPPAPLSTKVSHVTPQFGHLYSCTLSSEYPRLPACISSRVEPPTGNSFVCLECPQRSRNIGLQFSLSTFVVLPNNATIIG